MSADSQFTASDWPIAAAMLPFPASHDATGAQWAEAFAEVADAGFDCVDVTDSWVRIGDLAPARLEELTSAASESGVRIASISAIRRSVVDKAAGPENLAYSHRTLEAAAALGIGVVSFGLHQALTAEQASRLWFWTVPGHVDDPADWDLAVRRLRELGTHAEELGLLVSLEMYEDTFLGTGDSSVRLVEDIGLDNVGLNPDIGNLVRLHRPIESWRELVEKTMPYTNFWHVKNYSRDEAPERDAYFAVPAPMQFGLIDYRFAFRSAIQNGFQGVICAENYGGDGLGVSAANRDYLRTQVLPKTAPYRLGTSRVRQTGAAAWAGRD